MKPLSLIDSVKYQSFVTYMETDDSLGFNAMASQRMVRTIGILAGYIAFARIRPVVANQFTEKEFAAVIRAARDTASLLSENEGGSRDAGRRIFSWAYLTVLGDTHYAAMSELLASMFVTSIDLGIPGTKAADLVHSGKRSRDLSLDKTCRPLYHKLIESATVAGYL